MDWGHRLPPEAVEQKPAVSMRAAVKPDAVTCLECGFSATLLKRHIAQDHKLTPVQCRQKWNLPSDFPIVAPNYAEKRRTLALSIGLRRGANGRNRAAEAANAAGAKSARKPRAPNV